MSCCYLIWYSAVCSWSSMTTPVLLVHRLRYQRRKPEWHPLWVTITHSDVTTSLLLQHPAHSFLYLHLVLPSQNIRVPVLSQWLVKPLHSLLPLLLFPVDITHPCQCPMQCARVCVCTCLITCCWVHVLSSTVMLPHCVHSNGCKWKMTSTVNHTVTIYTMLTGPKTLHTLFFDYIIN